MRAATETRDETEGQQVRILLFFSTLSTLLYSTLLFTLLLLRSSLLRGVQSIVQQQMGRDGTGRIQGAGWDGGGNGYAFCCFLCSSFSTLLFLFSSLLSFSNYLCPTTGGRGGTERSGAEQDVTGPTRAATATMDGTEGQVDGKMM